MWFRGSEMQGQFITPTQGVLDCYDMDDFRHADMKPGTALIKEVQAAPGGLLAELVSRAITTWSHIVLSQAPAAELPARNIRLELWQAYHPYWHAQGCTTEVGEKGNLILNCPVETFRDHSVDLRFNDRLSAIAATVSILAWKALLAWLALLTFLAWLWRSKVRLRTEYSYPIRGEQSAAHPAGRLASSLLMRNWKGKRAAAACAIRSKLATARRHILRRTPRTLDGVVS